MWKCTRPQTEAKPRLHRLSVSAVAINLIVQHIQDILNGGLTKRLNGWFSGHGVRKPQNIESSSRPHWWLFHREGRACAAAAWRTCSTFQLLFAWTERLIQGEKWFHFCCIPFFFLPEYCKRPLEWFQFSLPPAFESAQKRGNKATEGSHLKTLKKKKKKSTV